MIPFAEAPRRQFFEEVRTFLGPEGVRQGERPRRSKQTEMLGHVAQGLTDTQIARELGLSPRTVEMHVALAMKALDIARRAEAVHRASSEGLLAE